MSQLELYVSKKYGELKHFTINNKEIYDSKELFKIFCMKLYLKHYYEIIRSKIVLNQRP